MKVDPRTIRRGDVVWLDMAPTVGHEQSGHRPYLVLSDPRLHATRHILITAPMTTTVRNIPTWHALAAGSYVICEQPTTVSIERVTKVDHAGHDTAPVRAILARLIGA